MRAAINNGSFPNEMPLEERFRLAREAGFEGYELELAEKGPVALESTVPELESVRRLAGTHGLELTGLATGLYWSASPTSSDPGQVKRADRILERQLEIAAFLGIEVALVVPGAVGAEFIPGTELVPYGAAYRRAEQFVAKGIPLAERLGVTIGVENVWNKFLLSPLEMGAFIDRFGSKRVAAYFDVGNVLATGYPEQWIAHLGPRIARLHFKDYRRNVGTIDGFVDLLSGDVDWPAVMSALRSVSYDGWCTAETNPPYKFAPEVLIHNTGRAMRAILGL